MFSLSWWKAKLAALGALLLALLYFFLRVKTLKSKKEDLEEKVNTLEARHHIKVVNEQIKKHREEKKREDLAKIKEEVDKDPEEFKGASNLSDPNNF